MTMTIETTDLPDVLVLHPRVYEDDRGFFTELYHRKNFDDCVGEQIHFVQDNFSFSKKNVLRGLHLQINPAQGKLIQVVHGEIYDVVVDARPHSKDFGKWIGRKMSASTCEQLWVPAGFAHGFLCLSDDSKCHYKVTSHYQPAGEIVIAWDDPSLNISWPLMQPPLLSQRDAKGIAFNQLKERLK